MSDVSQGPGWWIASDGKWYAPELHPDYQMPAPPSMQTPHDAVGSVANSARADANNIDIAAAPTETGRAGQGNRPLLLGLLAVVVIGALGFLGFRLLSGGGTGAGADSPEEAVQGLIDSVNEADSVGLLAAFDPEEADAWVSSFSPLLRDFDVDGLGDEEATDQAEDAYAAILSGLSLAVTGPDGTDPEYEITTLVEGHLASVRILGLDIDFGSDDPDAQPDTTIVLGSENDGAVALDTSALAGVSLTVRDDGRGLLGTATNADGEIEEDYAEDAHIDLVAIERDGEWYISVGYTLLELARSQGAMNDAVLPDFGAALGAVESQKGAATAEDAVRELFGSLETLDVDKMISLIDPVAVPYLHDYQPMIDVEMSPAERQDAASSFNLRIDELSLGQSEWEGRTVVTVNRIAGGIAEDGNFSFDFTTWCGQAEAEGDFIEGCAEEAIQSGLDELDDRDTRAADLLPRDLGFVVEQRNGSWYVHPLATIGYLMHQSATTLQDFVERNANALQDEVGSGLATSFFAIEAPIARPNSAATHEPVDGVAAVAINLADALVETGVREDIGVALFRLTTTSPGRTAFGYGSQEIDAGQLWGLAVDTRGTEELELPAVAVSTDGPITVEIVTVEPILLEDGYAGTIDGDGNPIVFQVPVSPVGSPDIEVFGAPYRSLSYWEDGLAVLSIDDESWDWISDGDFIVVFGDPGTDFEIFVF